MDVQAPTAQCRERRRIRRNKHEHDTLAVATATVHVIAVAAARGQECHQRMCVGVWPKCVRKADGHEVVSQRIAKFRRLLVVHATCFRVKSPPHAGDVVAHELHVVGMPPKLLATAAHAWVLCKCEHAACARVDEKA